MGASLYLLVAETLVAAGTSVAAGAAVGVTLGPQAARVALPATIAESRRNSRRESLALVFMSSS
jgi:hypothetical protein